MVLKAVIGIMEEESGMTDAGAENDEDELDDGDLQQPRSPMYFSISSDFFSCGMIGKIRHLYL